MKKLLLAGSFILAGFISHAQQTEFLAHANSGFFTLAGASTEKVSGINVYSNSSGKGYTNNPYSSNLGSALGLSGGVQRVTTGKFIFGASLGFDVLKNNMEINTIYNVGSQTSGAEGTSTLVYHFINFNPYIGYRFSLDCLQFDLSAGIDLAKAVKAHEKGTATDYSGNIYMTSLDRPLKALDTRARIQLNTFYKRAGLSLSYAEGLTNYKNGWIGGINQVYSRILRLGLVY